MIDHRCHEDLSVGGALLSADRCRGRMFAFPSLDISLVAQLD